MYNYGKYDCVDVFTERRSICILNTVYYRLKDPDACLAVVNIKHVNIICSLSFFSSCTDVFDDLGSRTNWIVGVG